MIQDSGFIPDLLMRKIYETRPAKVPNKSGGWVEMNGSYSGGDAATPVGQDARHVFRVGKQLAGRLLDGCSWDKFPDSREKP